MNALPIIQNFFGKPVRFFKTTFEVEMSTGMPPPLRGGHPQPKILIETYAVPLIDYANAIDYDLEKVKEMIKRSADVFAPFYRIEPISDTLGRLQPTTLMAQEMCDMLTAKLHTSRIKDPEKRTLVIAFQQRLMIAFHLIRTGKLRPVRWNLDREVPPEYIEILSLPSGRAMKKAVQELAEKEGVSIQTIYRHLQSIRGGNAETAEGEPKKTRADKGSWKDSEEFKKVLEMHRKNPELSKKEIAALAGVYYSKVTRWLRTA